MSQQYRLARGGKPRMPQRNQNDDNKQKFNNLRKNHQIRGLNLKIIGNQSRPVQILTARKANQQGATGRAAKIAANLQHMEQAARKKKEAQAHYYGQGQSPLKKQNFKPQNQQNQQKKKPNNNVQQRLGQNNKPYNNTNTKAYNNTNRKQFTPNFKQEKLNRIQNYNTKRVQNKPNQNRQQFNNRNKANPVRAVNPRTGEVKFLRPVRRLNQNGNINIKKNPQSFTVSVATTKHKNDFNVHHVSSELNPMIQEEIRIIQNKNALPMAGNLMVNSMTLEPRVPISTTRTTLHERFSRM